MIGILDTNHVSAVDRSSMVAKAFESRALATGMDLFVTVISIEEIMRGWLALLSSRKCRADEIPVYQRMRRSTEMFAEWEILEWDQNALGWFEILKKQRKRMSTADMKIASIALALDAVLLTQNSRDFESVSGLKLENWLE